MATSEQINAAARNEYADAYETWIEAQNGASLGDLPAIEVAEARLTRARHTLAKMMLSDERLREWAVSVLGDGLSP